MKKPGWRTAMSAGVVLSLAGCATVGTSRGPNYQRTREDAEIIRVGADIIKKPDLPPVLRIVPGAALVAVGVVHIPLAAICDTLDLVFYPNPPSPAAPTPPSPPTR